MSQSFTGIHPLEAIALKALETNGQQDACSLALHLAGREPSKITLVMSYRRVAQDVLENLEARGLVSDDGDGWYELLSNKQ